MSPDGCEALAAPRNPDDHEALAAPRRARSKGGHGGVHRPGRPRRRGRRHRLHRPALGDCPTIPAGSDQAFHRGEVTRNAVQEAAP
ncbi:hypothetical protein AB0I77_41675 [Streptomyces sp. NPDC050619]|uniref:hypothetical protein n=1 Tax=Streptomyces sp. NPDC050619 TaxID=3157214 RepID=UPI003420BAE4